MKLVDHADGCKGHYCISRPMKDDDRYIEYYNKGEWSSFGEVFIGKQLANKKLQELKELEIHQFLNDHFLKICNEEVKHYEDNPEYPKLLMDILNHSDIRGFCLSVSRRLLLEYA